jgi:hypothetical protein
MTLPEENARLREALEFYAEPFTWARVAADYKAGVRLSDMYGRKAREALKGEK